MEEVEKVKRLREEEFEDMEEDGEESSSNEDSGDETPDSVEKIRGAAFAHDLKKIERILERTHNIERETAYCLEVVEVSEEKRREEKNDEAEELLIAAADHIRFTTVSEIIIDALERQAPQETLIFFLEIYNEPRELWGMFNEYTDDVHKINKFWGYFSQAFPRLDPDTLKRLWQELHFQVARSEILLTFINLVQGYLESYSEKWKEKYSAEIEGLNEFLNAEKEIIVKGGYHPYPVAGFKGDAKLEEVRRVLIEERSSLPWGNRIAASLIGHPLSTNFRSFEAASAYHPVAKNEGERYFRSSGRHPLYVKLFNKGENVKGGLGYQPASVGFEGKERKYPPLNVNESAEIYDFLLEHKRKSCLYVSGRCKHLKEITVGFYQDYPCIMIYISDFKKKLSHLADHQKEGWVEIIISFFVGLINYEAQKANLPIELVRRSSFGFLTPTIAPCVESFRINPGVIPQDYADLLVNCLGILDGVLQMFNSKEKELDISFPTQGFLSASSKKEYVKYRGAALRAKDIVALMHERVTKVANKIRTGASFLSSSDLVKVQLSLVAHNYLLEHSEVDISPKPNLRYANAFCHALRWGLGRCELKKKGKELSFKRTDNVNLGNRNFQAGAVNDNNFFDQLFLIVSRIRERFASQGGRFTADVISVIDQIFQAAGTRNLLELFYCLEKLNELLFADAISQNVVDEDDYGSDSEVASENPVSPIYGKKVIVNHGMMSIQKSVEVAVAMVNNSEKNAQGIYKIFSTGTYYETPKAIDKAKKKLGKDGIGLIKEKNESMADVILVDLNPCVTDSNIFPGVKYNSGIAWVIDVTSASIVAQQSCIEKFRQCGTAKILFLISSGLKNEQMGADKIPYGTIRYFTKSKADLDAVDAKLRPATDEKTSGLPHSYRRMMKSLGCVPTNKRIMQAPVKPVAQPKARSTLHRVPSTELQKRSWEKEDEEAAKKSADKKAPSTMGKTSGK